MNIETLNILKCPKLLNQKVCGGKLEVPKIYKVKQQNIQEGLISCTKCGETFPIIFGISILLDNLSSYLNHYFPEIEYFNRKNTYINKEMMKFLRNSATNIIPFIKQNFKLKLYYLDTMIHRHFGNVTDGISKQNPMHPLLVAHKDNSWYKMMSDFINRYLPMNRSFAIDIGCGPGGLTGRLADKFNTVFGLDYDFTYILNASMIYKKIP